MAKARLNRKQEERLNRKAEYALQMEQAARVRLLAESIPSQAVLDTALLAEKDPVRRKAIYDFMKPWLRFVSHFPSELTVGSKIILP